jgi:hypothetical protein
VCSSKFIFSKPFIRNWSEVFFVTLWIKSNLEFKSHSTEWILTLLSLTFCLSFELENRIFKRPLLNHSRCWCYNILHWSPVPRVSVLHYSCWKDMRKYVIISAVFEWVLIRYYMADDFLAKSTQGSFCPNLVFFFKTQNPLV